MNFSEPAGFEIPDDWLEVAAAKNFQPVSDCYRCAGDSKWPNLVLNFGQIVAPVRNPGVRWFDRDRMIAILKGIVAGDALPPVNVHELLDRQPRPFALRDGFHRFYASAALGFKSVPVAVLPYFDMLA